MNTDLDTLRLFVRVAQRNSFSAAGRDFSLPQPTVSRVIARLEKDIGTALFNRSTRAVTLTEAGRLFLARIDPVLVAIDETMHEVRGDGTLRGTLRIGLSSSMATRIVIPLLPDFQKDHRHLRIDLAIDDSHQDIIADGMDVALRFGALADSSVIARKIAQWPQVLVASPAYLDNSGHPAAPADLVNHRFLAGPNARHGILRFEQEGRVASVRVEPWIMISQNDSAREAALAGLGIARMSVAGCERELAEGTLVQILPDWSMGTTDLHAIFAAGRAAKPAARAFVDFLIANRPVFPGRNNG